MGRLILVVLILACLVPSATAFHEFEKGQQATIVASNITKATVSRVNPPAGEIVNLTFDNHPEHTFQVVEQNILLTVHHSVAHEEDGNGVWNVSVSIDSAPVPECWWLIETIDPGVLGGTQFAHAYFELQCDLNGSLSLGSHTLVIERASQSGSPAPLNFNALSLNIEREDVVIVTNPTDFEALTGLTAQEFLAFTALVVIGIILWLRSTDEGVRFIGGFLPVVAALLMLATAIQTGLGETWSGAIPLVAFFFLTGSYLLTKWGIDLFGSRA